MKIIHASNHPVMAIQSVRPLVSYQRSMGDDSRLWVQLGSNQQRFKEKFEEFFKVIDNDFSPNPIKTIKRIWTYYRELKREKPDVLHSHACRSSIIPLFAGFLAKVPIRIYHNHGMSYLGHRGPVRIALRMIEKWNIFFSTHLICVGNGNLNEAISDGLMNGREVCVIHNGSATGIDPADFPSEEYLSSVKVKKERVAKGIDPDKFVVAYIGRPFKRKGFHLMLDAWKKSAIGKEGHKLLILGASRQDCQKVHGHLSDGIIPCGFVDDILSLIKISDVVALPSFHEGFPNVFLEGGACAKALLGTDVPGCRDAIIDGETGLIVPAGDVQKLAEALIWFKSNPERTREFGQRARERVFREFDRKDVLDGFAKFYEKIRLSSLSK